jgi:hypothetical protein
MKIRHIAYAILWVSLAVVCIGAQSGVQVDNGSIGGTVVNSATGKPEAPVCG